MRTRPILAVTALAAAALAATASPPSAARASAMAAPTPPMGWNGYNTWHSNVTEAQVKANAQALVSSGMAADGYDYVNLDGGWALKTRDAAGNLQWDTAKFPDGPGLISYVHSLGLKFGIYLSAGTENCGGTMAGSYGHYAQDAAQLAAWGVDFVKLDKCKIPAGANLQTLYTQFGHAVAATGRPMVYDVNIGANPHANDWQWGPAADASMWRVTGDIAPTYGSMAGHIFGIGTKGKVYDLQLSSYAHPGGWNDPDMLEVGHSGMSNATSQAEFSLWAEEAAPLIAGNDLTSMSAATRAILTNREVIAVDQDPRGAQGHKVSSSGGHWVIAKPLADGSVAVVFFNSAAKTATISVKGTALGLRSASSYPVRNLWSHTTATSGAVIREKVASHQVVMVRVG